MIAIILYVYIIFQANWDIEFTLIRYLLVFKGNPTHVI